jgi:hypothetical protein
VRAHELIVDSPFGYAARTVGVLALILYLSVRGTLAERVRLAFAR